MSYLSKSAFADEALPAEVCKASIPLKENYGDPLITQETEEFKDALSVEKKSDDKPQDFVLPEDASGIEPIVHHNIECVFEKQKIAGSTEEAKKFRCESAEPVDPTKFSFNPEDPRAQPSEFEVQISIISEAAPDVNSRIVPSAENDKVVTSNSLINREESCNLSEERYSVNPSSLLNEATIDQVSAHENQRTRNSSNVVDNNGEGREMMIAADMLRYQCRLVFGILAFVLWFYIIFDLVNNLFIMNNFGN